MSDAVVTADVKRKHRQTFRADVTQAVGTLSFRAKDRSDHVTAMLVQMFGQCVAETWKLSFH